jgi:F0F1-type ATP synthase assembly protein I
LTERRKKMVEPRDRTARGYAFGGPALVGGIVAGIGLGILLGDFFAWLLIGVGAGFVLMGLIAAIGK